MTTPEQLQDSFNKVKGYLTEDWAEQGITTPPTDKEVWGQLKAIAMQRMDEALADDMESSVIHWQQRAKMIDEQLEAIHINEQAEQHKATTMYEQGLRHY